MEKEESMMMRPAAAAAAGGGETAEVFLKWGSRKRLRCVRIRSNNNGGSTSPPFSTLLPDPVDPVHQSNSSARIRHRRITTSSSRFPSLTSTDEKSRLTRNSELATAVSRRVSPEKEERTYTTRGSVVAHHLQEEIGGGKVVAQADVNNGGDEHTNHHHHNYHSSYKNNNYKSNNNSNNTHRNGNVVWPKLYITLSSKEKEEDFLAMKGCKLPQRPKKRAKLIQRTILLVSPGAWLTDMTLERYEVREKKTSKKRPRGLKAMGNMDSDSE